MTEVPGFPAASGGVILAATDLGPGGDEAVRQAQERALAGGARLAVCHVASSGSPAGVADQIRGRTAALTGLDPGGFDAFVESGEVEASIVSRAASCNARLLVVGAGNPSWIAKALTGGVAERVVRHARGAVLVARPGLGSGTILVATDLSDPALPAVAAAAREAGRTGAAVTVLHCIDPLDFAPGPPAGMTAPAVPARNLTEELRDALEARLAEALGKFGLRAGRRVLVGTPAPEILRAARETGAGLIVVGTHGRTGLKRVLLGSVAEAVVRHASGPVLVVRLAPAPAA